MADQDVIVSPTPAIAQVPGAKVPQVANIRPPQVWLDRKDVAGLTPEGVANAVRLLQPLIAERAAAAETTRRPDPDVWDALAGTGVFHHFVPSSFGGCQFGLESFIDTMLPVGEVCASTCWAVTFAAEHNLIAALFPPQAQEELFAKGYCSAPGVSSPLGTAKRVNGGYRLTGHYKWGSGIMNADWVFAMAVVEDDPASAPLWFALRAEEVIVLDTWNVAGMAGTGSNDIIVSDIFIPEHRTLSWLDAVAGNAPGAAIHSSPLYRIMPVQFLALCTTIPIVAAARGMVLKHRERMMAGRSRFGSTIRQADKSAAQVRVARADMLAHSAELVMRDAARRIMLVAQGVEPASDLERQRQLAQCAHAGGLARKAALTIAGGAGASMHALSNPMQRMLRDILVASSHQLHEFDEIGEQYGRALFEIAPDDGMR